MWLSHPDYKDVACSNWRDHLGNLIEQILGTTKGIRDWAAINFDNVFKMKKKLLAPIRGIRRALDSGPNSYLSDLQYPLQQELNLILVREEDLWR